MGLLRFCLIGGLAVAALAVQAAPALEFRHGAVPVHVNGISVETGTVMTFQHASDSRIQDELLASLDIVSTIPTANGQWLLFVEGNTSPRQQGVSTLSAEANQDAGSALDRDDHGRLQVSSLHYLWYLGADALALGLINPAGPLDNSEIANNETSQFLATTLVNNPTIAFPDYALGMVYFLKPAHSRLDVTFLLSSSHGLGDNPDKSYAELVDVGAEGKGIFADAEVVWNHTHHTWRGGVWIQTAKNTYLDGSGKTADNYGIYLNTDHRFGAYGVNVRLGMANPKVSEAAQFVGLAVERSQGKNAAGIGYTYTFVSSEAGSGKGDRAQAEAYYRFEVSHNLSITPSIQAIHNSGFETTGTTVARNVSIVSARALYVFE